MDLSYYDYHFYDKYMPTKVGSIFAELPIGIYHGKIKVIPNLILSGTL